MTFPQVEYFIKSICDQLDIKFKFKKLSPVTRGLFKYPNKIHIDPNNIESFDMLMNVFFHELAHWYAYHNNVFPIYHSKNMKKFNLKNNMCTAVRAERWVDNFGKNTCKQLFPDIKWKNSYQSKEEVKMLREYVKYSYLNWKFRKCTKKKVKK